MSVIGVGGFSVLRQGTPWYFSSDAGLGGVFSKDLKGAWSVPQRGSRHAVSHVACLAAHKLGDDGLRR